MAILLAAVIFAEGNVQYPMLAILNTPVTPRRLGQPLRIRLLVADVVPHFTGLFAFALGGGDHATHARQVAPCFAVTQRFGHGRRVVESLLLATVTDIVDFMVL